MRKVMSLAGLVSVLAVMTESGALAGPFLDQYQRESDAQYSYDKTVIEKGKQMSAEEKRALYREKVGPVVMERAGLQGQLVRNVVQAIGAGVYDSLKTNYPFLKLDQFLAGGGAAGGSKSGGAMSSQSVGGQKGGRLDSSSSNSSGGSGGSSRGQVLDLSNVKAVEVFPGPPAPKK